MRLLVTVAHPDDEAFGCGSVLAHAAAHGLRTTVACATRGELGEVAAGLEARANSPSELGALREQELREATALLGVERAEILGWCDSGVDGAPASGSLAAADPVDVERAVRALIEETRPDVVVTLDASDGHRDHAVVRDATLAAVEHSTWRPERVYLWCLARSLLSEFAGDPHVGTPDEAITTVVDTSAYVEQRWKAMRAHRSQAPPYDAMGAELQRQFLEADRLVRVHPAWTGGPLEDDWIPGPERGI